MSLVNPFQNINKTQASIPLQEQREGLIIKKKAGRPLRPNMGKYLIKMDKALHRKLADYAEALGTSNSFVISQALRQYFSSQEHIK